MLTLGLVIGLVLGASVTAVVARAAVRKAALRERVSERRARAAERLAEIGSMTSGLAHEIKNPLSTIGLNAQLLKECIHDLDIEHDERSRLERRVGALRAESDRLRGILEDFLEYAGEMRLSRSRTDLNGLVSELADFFHVQAESAGARVRIDTAASEAHASIDANLVKQAVLNLMLNAVAAMDDPAITSRDLILRTAQVIEKGAEPCVAIHVIDTGPGMDEQTRERIFHPYYTTKRAGTGLGLATTRRIVDAHGGRVELHTELGTGSDFALVFPVEDPNPET